MMDDDDHGFSTENDLAHDASLFTLDDDEDDEESNAIEPMGGSANDNNSLFVDDEMSKHEGAAIPSSARTPVESNVTKDISVTKSGTSEEKNSEVGKETTEASPPPQDSFYRNYDEPRGPPKPTLASSLSTKFQEMSLPSTATIPISLPWKKSNKDSPENDVAPPPAAAPPAPPKAEFVYGSVVVAKPLKMETDGYFGAKSSYWTYEVKTEINGEFVSVRRRFRNIVALEDRLRACKPGVILPPRPDKNALLPLEEGHLTQSTGFVKKRAKLMRNYLNDLLTHPLVGTINNPDLHKFLSFPDDLGYAWPECSSSAFTRVGAAAAETLSGVTSEDVYAKAASLGKTTADPDDELTKMTTLERERIDQVNEAVPKLEAMVVLYKDFGDCNCATGMELSKLSKDMKTIDAGLAKSVDIIAFALLKMGRMVKKLGVDLEEGGMLVLDREYRTGRNELAAFHDRKKSLIKLTQKQIKAARANDELNTATAEVAVWGNYRLGALKHAANEANDEANAAINEAQEVADVLKGEIVRLGIERRKQWADSVHIVAKDIMLCHNELVSIWEGALTRFEKEFPPPTSS